MIGCDNRMGETTQVVAAESGIDDVMAFQQQAAKPFVIGISFRLSQKYRNGPIFLLRPCYLAVPVGSFNQSNADAPAALFGPVN